MTRAQQAAWLAYYACLRDHPDSTPEERQRGIDMLKKGAKLGIVNLNDIAAEDLA